MKIAVAGALGRMGRTLIEHVAMSDDTLAAITVRAGEEEAAEALLSRSGLTGVKVVTNLEEAAKLADAIIDFTAPAYTLEIAKAAAAHDAVHICGTTGFSDAEKETLSSIKGRLVLAPNMSIGVNVLMALVEKAAAILDPIYDIEIYEMHHKHKKDAPSGTGLGLGEAAAKGRGVDLAKVKDAARDGITGERDSGTIGFSVARGGDVVGDHVVTFAGAGERVELGHKASSRVIYAAGALKAAHWAAEQKPGVYSMQDVLGLTA